MSSSSSWVRPMVMCAAVPVVFYSLLKLTQHKQTSKNSAAQDEDRRKDEKPCVHEQQASELLADLFNVHVGGGYGGALKELDSYDDRNFYVKTSNGKKYTLKIHNGVEREAQMDCQNKLMLHLNQQGLTCPVPVPNVSGELISFAPLLLRDGKTVCDHGVRLLTWVEGDMLRDVPLSDDLLIESGKYLGRLSKTLLSFSHPAAERDHAWDLASTATLKGYLKYITLPERRGLVASVLAAFDRDVAPLFLANKAGGGGLRRSVLMGDYNDANIIVTPTAAGHSVSGVIDFGDMVVSYSVCEVAIALAYVLVTAATPFSGKQNNKKIRTQILKSIAVFFQGYCSANKLLPLERKLLVTLACCRLSMTCTYGAFSISKDPDNEYLNLHARPAWLALDVLWNTPRQEVDTLMTNAEMAAN